MNPILQFDPGRLLWEGLAFSQLTGAERPPTELLTRSWPQTGTGTSPSFCSLLPVSLARLGSPRWKPQNVLHQRLCSHLPSICSPSFQATWPVQAPCRLLAGGRGNCLSLAWACRAETPASLSRLRRPGPAVHTYPRSCPRGRALLRPSGGPAEPPPCLGLHLSAGGGNLTLAESNASRAFLDVMHKGMFILLTKKQALSFFFLMARGSLGSVFPYFSRKKGAKKTHSLSALI